MEKKILIVGGGFGGIRAALDLAKNLSNKAKIVLISDKHHFEYYPALYRIVAGRSPVEACVPFDELFKGKSVETVVDKVVRVDLENKNVKGESGSYYNFDFLILALGSETAYFNVPGLPELSFSFKSINEALKLKKHLHELFQVQAEVPKEKEDIVSRMHILIVGGGATGVEVAGELSIYLKKIAVLHKIEPSLLTIDLIEAAPRVLPALPPEISEKVLNRLHNLGVNIFLNRAIMKEDIENVYLKDMSMKSKTVIWTAGTKTHHLYSEIKGLTFAKNSRVEVDEFLQVKGIENVFIIGDAANTTYSGLAQTALYDASFVARYILNKLKGATGAKYEPKKVSYAIPVGSGFAAVSFMGLKLFGRLGWYLRRLVDLRFFLSILPASKALIAFQSDKKLCESCKTCMQYE